ncbi:MAG: hypothetical protein QOG99_1850 [Frankiales bacterium]|jgi:hypothetical protein|nr:hypothetical protein [Frankiales bacterium]
MRRLPATPILLAGVVLLTGCSSSSNSTAPAPTSSSPAPEAVTTSAAAVQTGLNKIVGLAASIKGQIGVGSRAKSLDAGIEPIWATIEGTVKKNDSDSYLALEDAFAVLQDAVKAGDASQAAAGDDAVSKAVTAYLARFPA